MSLQRTPKRGICPCSSVGRAAPVSGQRSPVRVRPRETREVRDDTGRRAMVRGLPHNKYRSKGHGADTPERRGHADSGTDGDVGHRPRLLWQKSVRFRRYPPNAKADSVQGYSSVGVPSAGPCSMGTGGDDLVPQTRGDSRERPAICHSWPHEADGGTNDLRGDARRGILPPPLRFNENPCDSGGLKKTAGGWGLCLELFATIFECVVANMSLNFWPKSKRMDSLAQAITRLIVVRGADSSSV